VAISFDASVCELPVKPVGPVEPVEPVEFRQGGIEPVSIQDPLSGFEPQGP